MEIAGYLAAVVIGLTLGLIGGGGAILTIPVFTYLFMVDKTDATSYSLFVVAATSTVGVLLYQKRGLIDWKAALMFAVPGMVASYLFKALIMPAVPKTLVTFGSFTLEKGTALMVLLSVLMFVTSASMIKGKKKDLKFDGEFSKADMVRFGAAGFAVGSLTGLLGAGGGFIIVPALVLIMGLEMKLAVGTSLAVITANCVVGFAGYIQKAESSPDWGFLGIYAGAMITGMLFGSALSKKIAGDKLKPVFGWFVLATAVFIILRETVLAA